MAASYDGYVALFRKNTLDLKYYVEDIKCVELDCPIIGLDIVNNNRNIAVVYRDPKTRKNRNLIFSYT